MNIIITTRPKPALGRLGLGGSSGVKTLGEGKISKNVTELHHYIYITVTITMTVTITLNIVIHIFSLVLIILVNSLPFIA